MVDLTWKKRGIVVATIKSNKGAECRLKLPDARAYSIREKGGAEVEFTKLKSRIVSFRTARGKSYTVKPRNP